MIQPAPSGKRRATRYVVAVLLAVAIGGTLWVPLYAHTTPRLGPFPFFYWFQLLWVPVSSALCWICYLLLRTQPAAGHREGARR